MFFQTPHIPHWSIIMEFKAGDTYMTDVLPYHKLHALIVDDFENFRSTLYKMLMDIGIGNVESANCGEDALKSCKVRHYDLILCDHNLGKGKSGQQVLEDLRIGAGPCSDSLFVLISAENSKSIIMAAYDYEPDAYLTKPITTKALEQRLVRLFEQRHLLKPIYQALKNDNNSEVIKLCKKEIAEGSRYANQCQKILGQIYIKTERIAEAEGLYRSVLDNRELEWAQLGMARTKIIQGDLMGAQQWLETVLTNNPLCMKGYDMQAEIYRAQGASAALQDTLQKATELSPLSILRQQALGEVAQQNNDLIIAANALRRAVKLGENSSFDKVSVHNQLAQTAIELHATDKELAKPILRDAIKCMTEMEGRFGKSPLVKAQAEFLESQLTSCSGDDRRAQEIFADALKSLEEVDANEAIDAEIEMIRSLRTLGRDDEAQVQLEILSRKYAGKQDALEKLDVVQDEPQSEKNKQLVAEINKKGIAAYNAKNYSAAAEAFSTALQNLPNHMGLRLNYVQAMIDDLKQSFSRQVNEKAAQTLAKTGVIISPKHTQYRRYRQLQDAYNNLVKEHGN